MTETGVTQEEEQQPPPHESGDGGGGGNCAVTSAASQQSLNDDDEHPSQDGEEEPPRPISSSDTTNSLSRSETYSVGDITLDGRVCGWLTMRARISKKWKRRWFLLEKSYLRYGNCEKKLSGKILLDGAKIRETVKDQKQFAFSIECKSGHRTYYLQADSEVIRNKWMQAMCFAKFSHSSEDNLSLCTTS